MASKQTVEKSQSHGKSERGNIVAYPQSYVSEIAGQMANLTTEENRDDAPSSETLRDTETSPAGQEQSASSSPQQSESPNLSGQYTPLEVDSILAGKFRVHALGNNTAPAPSPQDMLPAGAQQHEPQPERTTGNEEVGPPASEQRENRDGDAGVVDLDSEEKSDSVAMAVQETADDALSKAAASVQKGSEEVVERRPRTNLIDRQTEPPQAPQGISVETQTEVKKFVTKETQTDESSFHVQVVGDPMMECAEFDSSTTPVLAQQFQDEHAPELENPDPEIEIHDEPVPIDFTDKSAMFVSRTWGIDFGRSSIFNGFLATLVSMIGMTVFAPVLQRSNHRVVKDPESTVYKVHPLEEKLQRLSYKEPSMDWYYQHQSLYPHFSELRNVTSIIGYLSVGEDKGLIGAVKDFKETVFTGVKLIYFNLVVPEDFDDHEGESAAIENVSAADVVFSVGHQVHEHFETKYMCEEEPPLHHLYLPPVSEMFMKTAVVPPKGTSGHQQVLSVCHVKNEPDFEKYTLGAVAMGKLASMCSQAHDCIPKWTIIGVDKRMILKFKQFLQAKASCEKLHISVTPINSLKGFQRCLLQSVLFIAPENDSFNFPAYLAMQTGIPVLFPSRSGLAMFLEHLFPVKGHADQCKVETSVTNTSTSLGMDGENWKRSMMKILKNIDVAFTKAEYLKTDLRDCVQLTASHQKFLEVLA